MTHPVTIEVGIPETYVVRKTIGGWGIVYINADRSSRPADGGKIYKHRSNAHRKARQLNANWGLNEDGEREADIDYGLTHDI